MVSALQNRHWAKTLSFNSNGATTCLLPSVLPPHQRDILVTMRHCFPLMHLPIRTQHIKINDESVR